MGRPRGPLRRRPGATFPALDTTGAISYVQARYLDPRPAPKYDNPVSSSPAILASPGSGHQSRDHPPS